MNYQHFRNKQFNNLNPNFGRISPSQKVYGQYQNINSEIYKNPPIKNNLINTELEYQQDFFNQKMDFQYQNNFINNNNISKKNNNYINNNLIYQNNNESNLLFDQKKIKQEHYRKIQDQENFEMKGKIENNNFINNNIFNDINNNTNKVITRHQMNEEEKKQYRKKQMKYNEELRKQVEEKKKRKEMEKKKEKEEELKIEEKIKKEIMEEKQKEENLKKLQQIKKQREQEEVNNNNTQKKFNNYEGNYNYNNKEGLENTSFSGLNKKENNFNNKGTNQEYFSHNSQPQYLMSNSVRSNLSSNQNNIYYNNNQNINSKNFEEIYSKFANEQINIIEEYEKKINNFNNLNFNYKQLIKEKNEAMNKLQLSQDNFKNNFGMLPMNEQFNNKIAIIMDIILDQKVKEIQKNNNDNNISNLNIINTTNNNNNKNMISGEFKSSNDNFNLDKNSLSEKKKINDFGITYESQIKRDIIGCAYKSKYEELLESIMNGDDISNDLKTSMSLAGISKFVTPKKLLQSNNNNINDSNLYITWKEDNFNNSNKPKTNNLNNISINSNLNNLSNKNISEKNIIKNSYNNQEDFKIEEINNNDELIENNNMIKDSSEDININPQVSSIKNNKVVINNISIKNNLNNLDDNLNDSYSNKINEQLQKKSEKIRISKEEKNKSLLLFNDSTNNNIDFNYNPSLCEHLNINMNEQNENFINDDNFNDDNLVTKVSKEINNTTNLNSNQLSMKDSNFFNLNLKNLKINESDENVIIGNISINTTLKNNSVNNSKNNSINTAFNGTGKATNLLNNMDLKEVEEKDEEELYASEFKEDINSVKKLEEEEKYGDEFYNDVNEIEKLEEEQKDKNEENGVNLEDYKEIHESQRIQSQLNFFEDSIMDNININKSRAHVVGKISNDMNQSKGKNNNEIGNSKEGNNYFNKNDMEENKQINNNIISCDISDSYGDNILQNLNKYRKMALGESSLGQSISGQK